MAEGFEDNDEYVVPMVDYLSYRLHRAKIYRNRRRRERDIWWVWIQLKYEGIYVEACIKYYAKLVEEVEKDIYTFCCASVTMQRAVQMLDTEMMMQPMRNAEQMMPTSLILFSKFLIT